MTTLIELSKGDFMPSLIERYWRGFLLWRSREKLRKEREGLEQGVRERQEEAVKLGLTHMLIGFYREGESYQPWVSNFERPPRGNAIFKVQGQSYTIEWNERRNPYDWATSITLSLHDEGKELYRDTFTLDCDEFGLVYKVDKDGRSIEAYIPAEWVKQFHTIVEAVRSRDQRTVEQAEHSRPVLDDMKSKFGL
jgi:hypothetical protein